MADDLSDWDVAFETRTAVHAIHYLCEMGVTPLFRLKVKAHCSKHGDFWLPYEGEEYLPPFKDAKIICIECLDLGIKRSCPITGFDPLED
jgi:hypothetical protein